MERNYRVFRRDISLKRPAKQARAKITTQTLVEAATQVLVKEGYNRATTNRIADRAGISVGTLYRYFDNKEDLFSEVLEQIYASLLLSIANCPPQPNLRQLLETYNARLFSIFNNDSDLIQSLESLSSGPFQPQRNHWREKIIAAFAALLEPHLEEITCDNLDVVARTVVCATEGLGSSANSSPFEPGGFQSHLLRLQLAYLTSDIEASTKV